MGHQSQRGFELWRSPRPSRRREALLVRVLGVVALMCIGLVPFSVLQASLASAAGPPAVDVVGTSQFNNIACSSATSCVAVGNGQVSGSSQAVVVPISNGTPASPQGISGVTTLSAVACATTVQCDAVGGADVVPVTNGTAGTPTGLPGLALDSISCASATNCLAVGLDLSSGNAVGVPITNGMVGSPVEYTVVKTSLAFVVCPDSTECDGYGTTSEVLCLPHQQCVTFYFLETVVLGPDGTFVSQGSGGGGFFEDLSCPTATTCYATNVDASDGAHVGTGPGTAPIEGPFPIPNGEGRFGIACTSVSTCVASGQTAANGSDEGEVVGVTNGQPGTPVAIPGVSGPDAALPFVACSTATTCIAAGTTDVNGTAEGVLVPITLPTTSLLVPANGATLAEPAQFDASASSPGGIASVAFELTGGTLSGNKVICTGSPTNYGWYGQCTTTTVPNGTYTLQSVATNTAGLTSASAPITVTVDHPLPTTAVLIPADGGTESGGAANLDASASANVTSVSFELTGGPDNDTTIAVGKPTIYGWLAQWDTTKVPNGTYLVQSVAT